MTLRGIASLVVFLSFSVAWSVPCISAGADSSQPTSVLSQDDFVKQRQFMLKDLARKMALMQEARTCAEKSTTPVAFQDCNQAFLDGIRAQMSEPVESK